MVAPPVARVSDWRGLAFRVGGSKVNWFELDTPFSVAVSVTSVGEVTCPTVIGNSTRALLPSTVIVDGTGARVGCELASATVALAGTAAVSCTLTVPEVPLYITTGCEKPRGATETGVAGAELIVNVPAADQAVNKGRSGVRIPCVERTRQNLVPGVSDRMLKAGSLSCTNSGVSFVENEGSLEISPSYPKGCGMGMSVQVRVIGSVSVSPLMGDSGVGGCCTGLLKKTVY